MRLADLRRWHWMIIGLLVGLVAGSVRSASMNFARELDDVGGERLGQREFERALVARYQGRPGFTHMVVYPYQLTGTSAGAIRVHVVTGLYSDGQPTQEDGRSLLRWKPAYFVASVPYRPITARPPGESPTSYGDVLAYLGSLKSSAGVQYQYASWWWASRPLFVWTCATFLIVGVIWPTVINLLVYGQFTRPPEPEGISLLAAPSAPAAVAAPEPDLDAVRALDQQLEERLTASASATTAVAAAAPTAATPRTLATEKLGPASVTSTTHKEYGTKREDYYPTELGAKHET